MPGYHLSKLTEVYWFILLPTYILIWQLRVFFYSNGLFRARTWSLELSTLLCVSIFEKIWHLPEILWDIEEINRKKKRRLGIMMFLKIEKKYYEDVSQQIMQMMMCFPSTEVLKISWMWALSSATPNLQIHGKFLQNLLLDWVNQKRLFLKCQNYLWILAS